jgi:hypothetical protein
MDQQCAFTNTDLGLKIVLDIPETGFDFYMVYAVDVANLVEGCRFFEGPIARKVASLPHDLPLEEKILLIKEHEECPGDIHFCGSSELYVAGRINPDWRMSPSPRHACAFLTVSSDGKTQSMYRQNM